MRLSNITGTVFVVAFCIWAGADWGAKPALKDICEVQNIKCQEYQTAFTVSSIAGYTASSTAGIWFVLTQLLGINPVLWKHNDAD